MKHSGFLGGLRLRLGAWLEVWGRYRSVGRAAWAERARYDAARRSAQEAEFLPAALAVQETPVHPVPRAAAWLLVLLIVLAVAASIFLRTEVVVTGQGQLVTTGRTKSIQSLESAVVRRILVKDGDLVRAGDVLAELFIPGVGTDTARLRAELSEAEEEYQRGQRLLAMIDAGQSQFAAGGLLEGRMREYRDKVARLEAEIERKQVEIETGQEAVKKIAALLPNLRQKVDDYQKLEQKGYVARHAVLDQMQALSEAESEQRIAQNRVRELQAQLAESRRGLSVLTSEARRSTLEQMREANAKRQLALQDMRKFSSRDELMQIRSPIDGHVHQINVHTVGGVIGAAQPLMSLVPIDDPLEVEVALENKDIGRLRPGMTAQVKVDTFPYTRFGTVPASLRLISADAVNDERRGPIYKARLTLAKSELASGADVHKLSAGMTTVVEIKIGYRRVIHYFLDPFLRSMGESIHEW